MSIKQSKFFKGNARKPIPHPHRAGETITYQFVHTFDEELADTDILDLISLFPGATIVDFDFATVNVGTAALDIGLLTGIPGSKDDARVSGDELIDGVAANAATGNRTGLVELNAIPKNGEMPTSIGVKTATTIPADPTSELHIRIVLQG